MECDFQTRPEKEDLLITQSELKHHAKRLIEQNKEESFGE